MLFLAMAFPGIPWWWPMMAEASNGDTLTVGGIIALLGAIAAFIVKIQTRKHAFQEGHEKGRAERVEIEPNPLPVELVETIATKKELQELEARITRELKKIEDALGNERDVARKANGNIHARIDKSSEALAEVRGELKQISENTDRLLDIALKRSRS